MSFHVDLLVAVHSAVRAKIDEAGTAAYINVYDASNVLLSTLPLLYPCGVVDSGTGQLEFSIGARDEEAAAQGVAHHANLCDRNGKVMMSAPCSEGSAPVADTFVLASLTIVAGAPVELLSATLG